MPKTKTDAFRLSLKALALFSVFLAGECFAADYQAEGERFVKRAEVIFAGCESRFEGSSGNELACRKIEEKFGGSGCPNGYTEYEAPVFVPGSAHITIAGKTIRMYTLLPNQVETSAFPAATFSGKAYYLGSGEKEALDGVDLHGGLAIFDFDCGINYLSAMKMGAAGCIFIEPAPGIYSSRWAYSKVLSVPVNIPRYQVSREDGDYLKKIAGGKAGAPYFAAAESNTWRRKALRNYWALVRGTDAKLAKETIVLYANVDSLHYCPELQSGAQELVNLMLLLDLFDYYKNSPPKRSVLFMVFNSSHQYNAGAAEAVFHLFGDENEIFPVDQIAPSERKILFQALEEQKYVKAQYEKLSPEKISQFVINEIRDATDDQPGGRPFAAASPMLDLLQRQRHGFEVEIGRLLAAENHESQQVAVLRGKKAEIGKLVSLFNSVGNKTDYSALNAEEKALFEKLRLQVLTAAANAERRTELQLGQLKNIEDARRVFKQEGLFPMLALGIKLTYNNSFAGLSSGISREWDDLADTPLPTTLLSDIRKTISERFRSRVATISVEICEKTGTGWVYGKDDNFAFKDMNSFTSVQFIMQKIPAFELRGAYDLNPSAIGSGDVFSELNLDFVGRKTTFTKLLVNSIVDDAQIAGYLSKSADGGAPASIFNRHYGGAGEILSRLQDGSAITEPSTVLEDALIVIPLYRKNNNSSLKGGMLSYRIGMTDNAGRGWFYNLPHGRAFFVECYKFGESGDIEYATEKGTSAEKYPPCIGPVAGFREHFLALAFRCEKADLYGILHPKTLASLGSPKFYLPSGKIVPWNSSAIDSGLGCVFLPPETRSMILFEKNINLLNSSADHPQGLGYLAHELDRKSFIALSAKDTVYLDAERIRCLKDNAVKNNLVEKLHNQSVSWMTERSGETVENRSDDKYDESFSQSVKICGSAYTAYPMIRDTMTDMMKAAVFYLAVLIPFSFFLQRLLFSFVGTEAQIASFSIIFIITYLVFYNIHPAFRIAQNPHVVLIAFVMLVLGIFVSFCLKGKFDYHMEAFKERFSNNDDVGVLKLMGTALLIGVTNMKRRKMRTLLTCATIMLITFTMLSFTSVSQSVDPTRVLKSKESPYDGVFLSSQVWQAITPDKAEAFVDTLGAGYPSLQRGFATYDANKASVLTIPGRTATTVPMMGILALQRNEDGWLRKMPVVCGTFFSGDSSREIIVTDVFARKTLHLEDQEGNLGIPENYCLSLDGVLLRLVGIVDAEAMKSTKDLRGSSILPQVYTHQVPFGRQQKNPDELGEEEVPEGTFSVIDPQYLAIVPFGLRDVFDIPVTSVSVKMPDAKSVWGRATEYMLYSDDKLYFGICQKVEINPNRSDAEEAIYEYPGIYYLGSGYSTYIGGLSSLLIPLLVASTIIFNTMLGAVYERRKEIGIFNAIGLNPIHIAMFFVAEAMVYGLIGGVGGYLCGQMLAKLIIALGLFGGINLNYSSFSVVYVILFTMLIVVASSVYPALMAMRTAKSSSGRRRIVLDKENRLTVLFPYSFTATMAIAVNSYVKSYLDKHADSSIGGFCTEKIEYAYSPGTDKPEINIRCRIALSPYDLGITQDVAFTTFFNAEVGAFMMSASVDRLSGQIDNWVARNNDFLNGMRKYLLHWRVLSREGQGEYLSEALKMFCISVPDGEHR